MQGSPEGTAEPDWFQVNAQELLDGGKPANAGALKDFAKRCEEVGRRLAAEALSGGDAAQRTSLLKRLLAIGLKRGSRLLKWAPTLGRAKQALIEKQQIKVDQASGDIKLIYRVCERENRNGSCPFVRLSGLAGRAESTQGTLPNIGSAEEHSPGELRPTGQALREDAAGLEPTTAWRAAESKKITTKGFVHLGQERQLIQVVNQEYSAYRRGGPVGLPDTERTSLSDSSSDELGQRLSYSLGEQQSAERCLDPNCTGGDQVRQRRPGFCQKCGGPLDGNTYIRDDGLCASYGIFGATGSGKTNVYLYLLRQIFALDSNNPQRKFGGLILDPKAALISDMRNIAAQVGRERDLDIINTEDLKKRKEYVNIIDCAFEPEELGRSLVLAAQSAGFGASDPYWLQAMGPLLGAVIRLLRLRRQVCKDSDKKDEAVTLRKLLDVILSREGGQRGIQVLIDEVKAHRQDLNDDERSDAEVAFSSIEQHLDTTDKSGLVVEKFIDQGFGLLRFSRYKWYSPELQYKTRYSSTFYDAIIEEGKIVLVAISPADKEIAHQLCCLIKCLFQNTVLSRFARFDSDELHNDTRPLILACDEYGMIASEVAGAGTGDGMFFSQARQFGCMGLLAAQSVNVLAATPMREHWRSVFSNFGAKIFMRLVDNETAKEASELAGASDWSIVNLSASQSKEGVSSSAQRELRQRQNVPTEILTQVFAKGDGVVLGSLDGSNTPARTRFIHLPRY